MRDTSFLSYRALVVLLLIIQSGGQIADAKEYLLIYLGGQSNMDGYGKVAELEGDQRKPIDGVYIFHGNTVPDGKSGGGLGVWAKLQAGHGAGFASNGKTNTYSDKFGLELTFAKKLKERYPDRNFAFIKYSRGGTSIDARAAQRFGCWEPDFEGGEGKNKGINQYDHFLSTMRNARAVRDIDGDGEEDTLIATGILWMQGESDAVNNKEVASQYESHLKRLMDLIRATMLSDDLPVVIGRISDSGNDRQENDGKVWNFGKVVRAAQASYVEKDGTAALVTSTDNYGYSDPWHYDTAGYLDMGVKFADALISLLDRK